MSWIQQNIWRHSFIHLTLKKYIPLYFHYPYLYPVFLKILWLFCQKLAKCESTMCLKMQSMICTLALLALQCVKTQETLAVCLPKKTPRACKKTEVDKEIFKYYKQMIVYSHHSETHNFGNEKKKYKAFLLAISMKLRLPFPSLGSRPKMGV